MLIVLYVIAMFGCLLVILHATYREIKATKSGDSVNRLYYSTNSDAAFILLCCFTILVNLLALKDVLRETTAYNEAVLCMLASEQGIDCEKLKESIQEAP